MPTSFVCVDADSIAEVLQLMREFYVQQEMPFDQARAHCALEGLTADTRWGNAWLMRRDGETAGYLVMTIGYSLEFGGRYGLLDEFFVRESHRSQGLGQSALEFLDRECRARGLLALRLEVGTGNLRALDLYRRSGFREHRRYLMTRWLQRPRL